MNDIGRDVLVELLEILSMICMDPKSHDGIIFLFDIVTDHLTDPVVAESLGNMFYWISKVIKNPDFQLTLHESMKGVNTLFNKIDVLKPMLITIFKNVQKLIDDPNFDSTFELVIENVATLFNMKSKAMYTAGSILIKPGKILKSLSFSGPGQPENKIDRSTSNKN